MLAAALAPCATDLGERLYRAHCGGCHGIDGSGGAGPPLKRLKRAADRNALVEILQNGIPGTNMPAFWQFSLREAEAVAAHVASFSKLPEETPRGVAARGRALYAKQGCATCHVANGEGRGFGPELSGIGARRGLASLRRSLTEPAAEIDPAFRTVRAGAITGLRVNQDNFTVQIRDAAGVVHSLRGVPVELRKESLMPAYGQLSEAELDDLVAYLASLQD
jgi:putative heme-binding domain-containing protein